MSQGNTSAAVRVLVAEDDPLLQRLLERYLLERGYQVTVTADGRLAREHLEREAMDVLLTDIAMPGLGGMELIRWTHAHRPGVRIVAMTGLNTPELVTACLELGASRCLAKPFSMESLGRALAQGEGGAPGR